jgi:hypothetical protein
MIPPGTIQRIHRNALGQQSVELAYPPRNPATVYPQGVIVMQAGALYLGDGVTQGGLPLPGFVTVRDPDTIYPIGSLMAKPDNGKMYRGDGVTPGGILLQDATSPTASPVYWGKSAETTLDSAGILALGTTSKTSAAGTYNFTEGAGYAYLAFPAAWSTPTALMVSGFPFGTEDQAPYTTVQGAHTCAIVAVSGVNYRVFRSGEILNGSFTVTAS